MRYDLKIVNHLCPNYFDEKWTTRVAVVEKHIWYLCASEAGGGVHGSDYCGQTERKLEQHDDLSRRHVI